MLAQRCKTALALLAVVSVCGGAGPVVTASPMASSGPIPTFPRLTAFPNATVMAKVNAALAAHQKEDRDSRLECRADVKAKGEKPDRETYDEQTRVAYLSPRVLSISVLTDHDCGGPYPTNGAQTPLTFDLSTGAILDWSKAFKRGFLPTAAAGEEPPPSVLLKLYRAGYPKDAIAECRDAIKDADPFEGPPILYLDAKRGLVVQPDLPHVSAACAEEVALTPAQIGPYLRDPSLLADLKATVALKR